MTKKFLQISSNLFSLQFICFKQDLESFIGKEEHRFKAASALNIKNIIKLPGTRVDAISMMSYLIHFWVISLETDSEQSGCSNSRL